MFNLLQRCRAHLDRVQENYFQHLVFAIKISMRVLKIALFLAIHALIPGVFQTRGSDEICALSKIIQSRRTRFDQEENIGAKE